MGAEPAARLESSLFALADSPMISRRRSTASCSRHAAEHADMTGTVARRDLEDARSIPVHERTERRGRVDNSHGRSQGTEPSPPEGAQIIRSERRSWTRAAHNRSAVPIGGQLVSRRRSITSTTSSTGSVRCCSWSCPSRMTRRRSALPAILMSWVTRTIVCPLRWSVWS